MKNKFLVLFTIVCNILEKQGFRYIFKNLFVYLDFDEYFSTFAKQKNNTFK